MATSRTRRPARGTLQLETLCDRVVPAVGLSTVNDNWVVITDVGTPGLSTGDTVRNDADTIAPGTIIGVLGTDAFTSINDAVTNTVAFGTVRVLEGTYSENVVIGVSNLTVVSLGGRDLTTITGTPTAVGGGSMLGTVVILSGTNNVTFGAAGAGFTVNGFDGTPGSEASALYLQGNQTGTTVRGNRLVANGDEALLSEFGGTVVNLTVDGNIFDGTTFVGAPAGDGSGAQFTLLNVPRQLIVLGGGNGGGTTSNLTFTNNQVIGTAGGISTTDNSGAPTAAHEQGNNLAALDSVGAVITGNTFAGTTTRFGVSFQARGPNTTISGNTFSSANLTPTTGHVFLRNNQSLDAVAAASTFDKYAYVSNAPGADGTLGVDLQRFINVVSAGTTINVLGTFTGNVDVNKAVTVLGNFGATGAVGVSVAGATIDGAVTAGAGLTLISGSTLVVDLNSATAFDQSAVTGAVALNGATLTLNSNFTPAAGTSFVIIANDGTDAVSGTFAGLPEGSTVTVGGTAFVVSYVGGDGNDVTLTSPPAPVTQPPANPPPQTTNPPTGPTPTPGLTANERFVNNAYLDLLGRNAEAVGLAAFTARLNAGESRFAIARDIENSVEGRTTAVQALYQRLLGRAADPAGLNAFVAGLARGRDLDDVVADMVGSQEYFQKAGGTNLGFVQQAYRDLLGRELNPATERGFLNDLAGGTDRIDVGRSILSSAEGTRATVGVLYQQLLGRPADAGGLNFFAGKLQAGAEIEDVILAMVSSPENAAQNA